MPNKLLVIGVFNIIVGLFFLDCAFNELSAFNLFYRGFAAYEGFGFGSFIFGLLVFFIYVYAVLGIILIFLGLGFLRRQWWAWEVSRGLLLLWEAIGLILLINIGLMFTNIFNNYFAFKNQVKNTDTLAVILFTVIVFLIIPGLYGWLLQNRNLINSLRKEGYLNSKLAVHPLEIILLIMIYIFLILFLSWLIFLKSTFPIMGAFLKGTPGLFGIIISICILVFLIINTIKRAPWTRPVSIGFFLLVTVSNVYTFSRFTFLEICDFIGFPEREMKIIEGIYMLKDFKLSALMGLPFLVILWLFIQSKRHSGEAGHSTLTPNEP